MASPPTEALVSRFLGTIVMVGNRTDVKKSVAETYRHAEKNLPRALEIFYRKYPIYKDAKETLLKMTDPLNLNL